MDILILTPWYPNPRFPLEGSFVESQALALQKQGVDIRIACLHLSPYEILRPIHHWFRPFKDLEKNLDVIRLEGPFFPKRNKVFTTLWSKTTSQILKTYLEANNKPQLIHAHTLLGAIAAYFLSKKIKVPYVIHFHESSILENRLSSWQKQVLAPALCNASHIFSVSNALKNSIQNNFDFPNPISIIPNNINTDLFYPSKKKQRDPIFNWIAIGDLKPIKQFDLLLYSFKQLIDKKKQSFHLKIIGYGPQKKALQSLIHQLGLKDKVSLMGYLHPAAIPDQIRQSHALVMSSRAETFGIVLTEALACGLPVVSTDCLGPRDIINSENGILSEQQNAESLASAMLQLYQNYESYNAKKIRDYAINNFSDEIIATKIQRVYHKILSPT